MGNTPAARSKISKLMRLPPSDADRTYDLDYFINYKPNLFIADSNVTRDSIENTCLIGGHGLSSSAHRSGYADFVANADKTNTKIPNYSSWYGKFLKKETKDKEEAARRRREEDDDYSFGFSSGGASSGFGGMSFR